VQLNLHQGDQGIGLVDGEKAWPCFGLYGQSWGGESFTENGKMTRISCKNTYIVSGLHVADEIKEFLGRKQMKTRKKTKDDDFLGS
jgi:hypothetical protein